MIKDNLDLVRRNIENACKRAKRDPTSVRVMAVSKGVSLEAINEARSSGLFYFGENRVQEAREKKEIGVFSGAELALIGHLQTNKASMAARIFDEVQSVDTIRVAEILSKFSRKYKDVYKRQGENRAKEAAMQAIASPLLETSIEGAKGVLMNVTGGPDLGLFEVTEAADIISQAADPDANIIFGAVINDNLEDTIQITVIATGFDLSLIHILCLSSIHQ